VVGNNQSLPVELLSFDAKNVANSALLNWQVASEINNAGWDVQRSINGFTWETIGFVQGNGNRNEIQDYSYVDIYNTEGRVFYRLVQIDFDGTKSYSDVKTIRFLTDKISIYPTLAKNVLNINWENSHRDKSYKIVNSIGEIKLTGEIDTDFSIDVSYLSKGMYFLNIGDSVLKFSKL